MLKVQKKINQLINKRQYYNSYFNRCINKYKKIENYYSLYEEFKGEIKSVKTSEIINHSSKIFFGVDLYDAKKNIDVPYRLKVNKKLCDIIFYKTKLDSHKIIVELHFFKKKLVFFKYLFPTTVNRPKIEERVKKKYLKNSNTFCNKSNLIVDEKNNYLRIENEVSLTLNYYSLEFDFFKSLKKYQMINNYENFQKKQYRTKKFNEII
ncbi:MULTISPECIES: hypothetical protein [Tenacibaculum]|uniref:hypothetical protein n=1 Tax=Tenacibaculum TaxID=104267 RepID=UPI000DEA52F2|nr:hypothetical protein [Tenacibaculum sp. E3R01]RBW62916.1 hypothetical protein DS884_00970 [Tenacibaculum sp. E3R01]